MRSLREHLPSAVPSLAITKWEVDQLSREGCEATRAEVSEPICLDCFCNLIMGGTCSNAKVVSSSLSLSVPVLSSSLSSPSPPPKKLKVKITEGNNGLESSNPENYYMCWIGRYNSGWYPRFVAEWTRLPNGLESKPNGLELQPNGLESSPNRLTASPNGLENSPNGLESGRMDSRDL